MHPTVITIIIASVSHNQLVWENIIILMVMVVIVLPLALALMVVYFSTFIPTTVLSIMN